MNRNRVKQLLPIIQAYAEGKVIQSRCIKGDTSLWYDEEDPSFDEDFEYRIKPEPKYRPFKNAEECWAEMLKHQPFGWVKDKDNGNYSLITDVDDTECEISLNGCCGCCMDYVRIHFTFVDGVPFGVKEDE